MSTQCAVHGQRTGHGTSSAGNASEAWDEAWRAARSLAIGVDAGDLERRIRAGVVCLHAKERSACRVGCRCAWSKALASRRRSVAISPASVEDFAAVPMPKKRANWYLQRAEGKAAMASYLGAAGPRVTEQQWWDRRAQARRAEVPRGATAVPASQQASRGRKRAQLQGVRKPAVRVAGQQRHLHMVSESRVAETLLLRKVFLVEPVRGLSGSWIPACLWRDDFEEAWWCDGVFAGAGEDWAVRHGFAEIIISKAQRAGPGPARGS